MTSKPECLLRLGAELGEGLLRQAAEQTLYFVDIKGQQIHRCAADGSQRQSWAAPQAIGFVQPLAGGLFSFQVDTPGLPQHLISQGLPS